MKRARFRTSLGVATLIAGLVWSLTPAPGVSASVHTLQRRHNRRAAKRTTLAHTAEVKVTAGPNGVLIEWRTSFEIDNLGFNVYRDHDNTRTQVNPSIIAGSALIAGQGTPLYAGNGYSWFDAAGTLDSHYYLEDINLDGASGLIGPFTPVWNETLPKTQQSTLLSSPADQSRRTAQTGGAVGTLDQSLPEPAAIQDQWAIAAQPGVKIGVRQDGWYRVTQPELVAAGFDVSADARNLRLFVNGHETPIEVSRDSGALGANDFIEFYGVGIDVQTTDTRVYYLINGSQSGLRVPVFGEVHTNVIPTPSPVPSSVTSASSDQRNVSNAIWFNHIWAGIGAAKDDDKQPTVVIKSQGEITPSGESYNETGSPPSVNSPNAGGQPAAAKFTSPKTSTGVDSQSNAFPKRTLAVKAASLQSKKSRNRRRRNKNHRGPASALGRKRNHAALAANSASSFLYATQLKERMTYFSALLNGEAENFFGRAISTTPITETLNLANVQTTSAGTARLQIALQGVSNQAHTVNIFLNDAMIGSVSFSFQESQRQRFDLSPSQLLEGANTIKLVQAGGSGDVSIIDYVRITYPHTYRADNNWLSFAARSTQTATIDGFTTPDVRVLDISDPSSVQEVRPIIAANGRAFRVTVPSTGVKSKTGRTLLMFASSSFLQPASIVANQPSTLNQANNAADLLIISHQNFIPSLAPLVTQRQAQGFTVAVVNVDDVYDEFGYGLHMPQAIKDFLARASAQWTIPPRYVLLVGDASYDPRNYFGLGNFDFVPSKLIDTAFMEAASDDWLADFDDDGIPEIPIGRLAVRTAADADREISKIVNFSPANVPQTALMVADTQGSYYFNFEQATEQLIPMLPANMQSNVRKIYRRLEPSDAAARTEIINRINLGAALVNYSGHGSVDIWTGGPIFSTGDALALTNGNRLPLVVVMDCLNGYFVAPGVDCIGEALLKAPNGGAVASFASSGLTIPDGQHDMGQRLFQLLYGGQPIALGDATRQAKAATTDLDVRRTWILFGDPTMKIR